VVVVGGEVLFHFLEERLVVEGDGATEGVAEELFAEGFGEVVAAFGGEVVEESGETLGFKTIG